MVDRKVAVDAKREYTIDWFVVAGLAEALMKISAADTAAVDGDSFAGVVVVGDDSSAGIVVDVDVGGDRTGAEDALCTEDDLPST